MCVKALENRLEGLSGNMLIRYAGLDKNDIVNGKGFCVSFWTQYCPHKCKGCHNPETWSETGGLLIEYDNLLKEILQAISANGILRNFSLLGGEPLCEENIDLIEKLIKDIKQQYPNILIYCWTGYRFEDLRQKYKNVLQDIDVLIDGKFILEQRDITLKWRGSSNQRVIDCKKSLAENKIILKED